MNSDEVCSSGVLAKGEWQLLCSNQSPCSLAQTHVAATAAFESAVCKCYQLDKVSEQKEWEISAWLSSLNYLGFIRKAFCTDQSWGGEDFEYSEGNGDFAASNVYLVVSFCTAITTTCREAAAPLAIAWQQIKAGKWEPELRSLLTFSFS